MLCTYTLSPQLFYILSIILVLFSLQYVRMRRIVLKQPCNASNNAPWYECSESFGSETQSRCQQKGRRVGNKGVYIGM